MTDYPDCSDCETDLFVAGCRGRSVDWRCHRCGRTFDDEHDGPVVPGVML